VKEIMLTAIREAERFIYVEDQYLVNPQAARALRATLKKESFQQLIILIADSRLSDLPHRWKRRRAFLHELKSGLTPEQRDKVFVGVLANPDGSTLNTYVHSKAWVIDDELAIIGSANCNRRGWEYDTEVIAAIGGSAGGLPFAQQLRISLWSRHLGLPLASLGDAVESAAHWRSPPPGARIRAYDPTGGTDPVHESALDWDTMVDPPAPLPTFPFPIEPSTALVASSRPSPGGVGPRGRHIPRARPGGAR
jgi:phosphatidylserine/phosphatidylglycerophosphate/cardiolipin synthase-like enzyme